MNLNKVILIGRLTQDPEARSTATGMNVTTLRMATNRVWNDKSGQKQESTEFHTVIAWARLGEIANQYLKKGALIMIEGRLQTRSWTDKNNNKRYNTEIVAENLQMGPRSANSSGSQSNFTANKNYASSVNVGNDVKQVSNDDIPIINEDEPTNQGVEEEKQDIQEKDLPF
jgi:single-strand DNA-binding protein